MGSDALRYALRGSAATLTPKGGTRMGEREWVAAFAGVIRELFPGCPAGEETAIAEQAFQKLNGRTGHATTAEQLDPEAVRRAVVTHIRHRHTDYDRLLLCEFGDRELARAEVQDRLEEVIREWQTPPAKP
jgi:hypothetical protein